MKVVLDANVYVSAFINTHSTPKQIINLWRAEAIELLTSDPILSEINMVLRYPRIAERHKMSELELQEFLTLLREESRLVIPKERLQISSDDIDNRYLECAEAGGAEFLVTGDKKHLPPIGQYQGVRIVSPATFLAIVKLSS